MEGFSLFIINAALTAFGFFVMAPILLNAISTFTVQKKFAQTMVEEGVIDAESVKKLQPKKQIAGAVIAAIVVIAASVTAHQVNYGTICLGFGFLLGLVKYRNVLQFNSLTVKRFQNTYKDAYDAKKLNKYVDRIF